MDAIRQAMESVEEARNKAENCPYHPKYHFSAPALWMNDPNGTIFHKGEYHLFYQHNPYGSRWDSIHWGHAKSKDLVHWEHLPIALTPSTELGEHHCFSGCCVINNGIPSILYTSIKLKRSSLLIKTLLKVKKGAEQWLATSDDEMITWRKYPGNPVMTDELHGSLKVRDWRDPYIWHENDVWFAALGGHIKGHKNGAVFLYQSKDLINWKYLYPLCEGTKAQGRNGECPNFFPLENRHVLIVSPENKVIYAVGKYENYTFTPEKWEHLDHGRCFYATNTIFDDKNRVILFGWIQYGWLRSGGLTGWNGCISLPRILSLDQNGKLKIVPAPELEALRKTRTSLGQFFLQPSSHISLNDLNGNCFEISAEIEILDTKRFGFEILKCKKKTFVGFDTEKQEIIAGKEKGKINFPLKNAKLKVRIFIDKSVIEMFVDGKTTISALFYPKKKVNQKILISAIGGSVQISNLDVWGLGDTRTR